MNIKDEILKEHSKQQAIKIVDYIGTDPKKFAELMHLFFDREYRTSQRAAWVVSHCIDRHPGLAKPHLRPMILNLRNEVHAAVTRNTFRTLQFLEIPDDLVGETVDIGFTFLEARDQPIAVKVFAMTVLANICKKIPGLKKELSILIEDQMPYASAGFRNRGSKILKQLVC